MIARMPRLRVLLPALLAALLIVFGGVLLIAWNSGAAMVVSHGVVTSRASLRYVYAIGKPSNYALGPGLLAGVLVAVFLCRARASRPAWERFVWWAVILPGLAAVVLTPWSYYRWHHFGPVTEGRMLHSRQISDMARLRLERGSFPASPSPEPSPPSLVGTSGYWYCWDAGPALPHQLGHPVAGDHFCTFAELRASGFAQR